MSNQIQCAECLCTLYFTGENGSSGVTGELCESCQQDHDNEDDDDDQTTVNFAFFSEFLAVE